MGQKPTRSRSPKSRCSRDSPWKSSARAHTPAGRIRAELDRLNVPARQGRSRQGGVHARRAARRGRSPRRAGCSSPSSTATARSRRTTAARRALKSRNGNDLTASFPDVARAVAGAAGAARGDRRRARDPRRRGTAAAFRRSRSAARLSRAPDIRHAAAESPGGVLRLRSARLRGSRSPRPSAHRAQADPPRCCLPPLGPDPLRGSFREGRRGAHGARRAPSGSKASSAKKADAPYKGGRTAELAQDPGRSDATTSWWSASPRPKGSRGGFGALQLGDWVDGELIYAGRAGSGLQRQAARRGAQGARGIGAQDAALQRPAALAPMQKLPARRPIPDTKDTTWVEPTLVCEVQFKEWTEEGLLRQPVFLRFRDDKKPEECLRQGQPRRARPRPPTIRRAQHVVSAPEVPLSNLDKVVLAGREVHQGRPDRVLPRHLALAAALSEGPSAGADALSPTGSRASRSTRRTRRISRPDWIRTVPIWSEDTAARGQLLRLRRRRDAALCRQHGLDPAAHLGQPGRCARAPRLVHPRSRPQGRAVRATSSRSRCRCTGCATTSSCPTTSRPADRPACTCSSRWPSSAPSTSRGPWASCWPGS